MSVLNVLAGLGLFILIFGFASALRSIIEQRRAEQHLVLHLVGHQIFRDRLLDYLESLDRDGVGLSEEQMLDVARIIAREAELLQRGSQHIGGALKQPSAVGRVRYVEKLLNEVVQEMEHSSGSVK